MFWKNAMIKDLLHSLQRLNEELSDRTKFEHQLIQIIEENEEKIKNLEDRNASLGIELDHFKDEIERFEEEGTAFREYVEKTFLKEGEQFVREEDGTISIYPERVNNEE